MVESRFSHCVCRDDHCTIRTTRKADVPGILSTDVAEKTHGTTASGVPITNKLVAKLADNAEAGYNVDAILRRRGGRRAT